MVEDLQNLLRDRYKSGFPVFKELLQNADDAGANRLNLCAHAGFPDATNPLLRAPSIIIANDGLVMPEHFAAMEKASGGSKGGDAATVGRFGLGQKAVFHLCDAFVAFAWIDGEPAFKVMNPWEEIPDAAETAQSWKELSGDDKRVLARWFDNQGFDERGIALFLPLRTEVLLPGAGLWLTPETWTTDEALADIAGGDEFVSALCCLRTIGLIEFSDGAGKVRRLEIEAGSTRLSGPKGRMEDRSLTGSWSDADGVVARFSGRETWCPNGQAASVKGDKDWPSARDYRQQLVKAEAEPHGAVILCRSAAVTGRLRLRSTVYLPVETIVEEPLPAVRGNIDLLLHGHFFVSSARTKLLTMDDPGAEGRWNAALETEATLPQVLPALADAIPMLPDDVDRGALLNALQRTEWWARHRETICNDDALAQVWPGMGVAEWRRVPATTVRSVPGTPSMSRERLSIAFLGLADWCAQTGIVFAHGPVLAAGACRWTDVELAALVRFAGAAAFTKPRIAETVATLLDNDPGGLQTRTALAAMLRDALLGADRFAPSAIIQRLVAFLPGELLLPLPRSATSRPLLAALAAAGSMLPLPGDWDVPDPPVRLEIDAAIGLLSAAAGFVNQGDTGTQAAAVINAVLRRGPPLGELARHPDARDLAIVPVTRIIDRRELVLTLAEAETLGRDGVLFDALPNRGLDMLADAVVDPPVHRLRWQSDSNAFHASNAQPANLVRPLRSARRFGEAEARGRLAHFLRDVAEVTDLRRLCAGDPDLPASMTLVALDSRLSSLAVLMDDLLVQRIATTRSIPPPVIGELTDAVKHRLGIETVQPARLGDWLIEADRAGRLPALPEPIAIALLTSSIADDVLRTLPVHRTVAGARASVADGMRRAAPGKVPASLMSEALLLNPWNDPDSFAIEQRLVPSWTALDQIETALRSSCPSSHIAAIAEAIVAIDLSAPVAEQLAITKWLPLANGAVAPGEVLDLDEDVDRALAALLGGDSAFPTLAKLPHQLRAENVMAKLRGSNVLPGRTLSLQLAGELVRERGGTGVGAISSTDIASWRAVARERIELPVANWPVIAAVLRSDASDENALDFARPAEAGGPQEAVSLLQELAAAAKQSTAVRELHRIVFAHRSVHLLDRGFLPADLLVPSVAGPFERADRLALNASGIDPISLLDRYYAERLQDGERVPAPHPGKHPQAADLAERLAAIVEPFRDLVPDGAMLCLLAMLGRDEVVRAVAATWPAQRSFDQIAEELDGIETELEGLRIGEIAERLGEVRFELAEAEDAAIEVLSAAGLSCRVPLDDGKGTWLIDCQRPATERDAGGRLIHPVRLAIAPVQPSDESHARQLMLQFVGKLAPALQLALDVQREALVDRLKRHFNNDQATLEETTADLKRVMDDRLHALKPGERTRDALKSFDTLRRRDLESATRDLWAFVTSDEAAPELLAAVRRKISDLGYRDGQVLFELFQNADDALRFWTIRGPGRFRVESERDETGSITFLRVIHWGRPINHPGFPPEDGLKREHDRDLAYMLAIGQSGKDGDGQTGQFGLGFKTVHMLSDEARLASGDIAARIRGGMVPVDWAEGRAAVARYLARGEKPTLIELPISPERAAATEQVLQAFAAAAPWLVAVAPRIGRIEIDDEPAHAYSSRDLAEGIAMMTLTGRSSRRVLRLQLGDHRLFVPIGTAGPENARDARQFWHLVPLDGQERHGGWIMDGPFPVDPGRSHFAGAVETHEALFRQLGVVLGDRLLELFDTIDGDWSAFADSEGLDPGSRATFWVKLVDLFAQDLNGQGAERHLHHAKGGLARLLRERPLVPVCDGNMVCAGEVHWRLAGALADPAIAEIGTRWPQFTAIAPTLVREDVARRLEALGVAQPRSFDLARLVERVVEGGCITPAIATTLGTVINTDKIQRVEFSEQQAIRKLLRETPFVARDGTLQPIRFLGFPQGDTRESQRAAFAPPAGQLADDYVGAAFEVAQVAREQAGHNEEVWRRWAGGAGTDQDRLTAFLTFLAGSDRLTIIRLADAAKAWMPDPDALQDWPALAGLPGREFVLAALGVWPGTVIAEPTIETDDWEIDAATAFEQIAEWWENRREELAAAYDRDVYPEDFDIARLANDDDEAWFTMLALATFQTLGRIQPEQSRGFVQSAMREGWWRDLAGVHENDDLAPFAERLRIWSEPWPDPVYGQWRRCLVDLCTISRYLPAYRRLFLTLPRRLAQEDEISLRMMLTPGQDQIAARMGIVAARIEPSLGIGANWLVRELTRNGIYDDRQAARSLPYGWATAGRVRRLFATLDLGKPEHGMDAGRQLHAQVADLIGDLRARFCGDGDLPLHIITTAKHRDELSAILHDAGASYGIDFDDD